MTYRIVHRTTYKYKYPITFGNHVACLTPRTLEHHECHWSELRIEPKPTTRSDRTDYFGNRISLFTIQEPHKQLVVEARSEVSLDGGRPRVPDNSPPWEEVARMVPEDHSAASLAAYQFDFESPRIKPSAELAHYAQRSFTPGRPWADGLLDLTGRIYRDFQFDAKATNVRTSTEEFFRKKRGVCQDFAHLQIACLRSIHLPARYVSGYLRTYPPPGKARLIGADASHAWLSAYCPDSGWLDVDPTNNLVVGDGHVTLAWGRDYGDVSPLRGLILGGRDHVLRVSVDVEPLNLAE
jgi:transglutaminase-like putative cysteine protease